MILTSPPCLKLSPGFIATNSWLQWKRKLRVLSGETPGLLWNAPRFQKGIKRFLDGGFNKFKGQFCVCGDFEHPRTDVDLDAIHAPTASWSIIRMLMVLVIQEDWCTK